MKRTRSTSSIGRPSRQSAFTKVKNTVFAPIPSASTMTTA